MILIPILVILLAIIAYFVYKHYILKARRKLITHQFKQYEQEWHKILLSEFEPYAKLPDQLQNKLINHIQIFMSEKKWKSSVSNDLTKKILISAKATVPLMNRKTNYYPGISSNFEEFTQKDWLEKHWYQFSTEVSKLKAHQLKENFGELSYQFFFSPHELKTSQPDMYQQFQEYFKVNPEEWL